MSHHHSDDPYAHRGEEPIDAPIEPTPAPATEDSAKFGVIMIALLVAFCICIVMVWMTARREIAHRPQDNIVVTPPISMPQPINPTLTVPCRKVGPGVPAVPGICKVDFSPDTPRAEEGKAAPSIEDNAAPSQVAQESQPSVQVPEVPAPAVESESTMPASPDATPEVGIATSTSLSGSPTQVSDGPHDHHYRPRARHHWHHRHVVTNACEPLCVAFKATAWAAGLIP